MNELQKIMLATQTINFLSASIYEAKMNLQHLEGTGQQIAAENDRFLSETTKELRDICEVIGGYFNGKDMQSTYDIEATRYAFKMMNIKITS